MFWVSWRCVNKITEGNSSVFSVIPNALDAISKDMLLLLKSVEFHDDAALLLSVAGLVMGPHVTSESEIGGTDSAALRTSWTCLWLCGSCVTSCTSFFRDSDPAIYEAPGTSITDNNNNDRLTAFDPGQPG